MTEEQFADYVAGVTVNRIEFDAAKVPLFDRPVVYMALSSDTCLYIGMSTKGMCRAFSRDHHVLKHIWGQITKLEVYELMDEVDARQLEDRMIKEFKPIHNERKGFKYATNQYGITHITKVIDQIETC